MTTTATHYTDLYDLIEREIVQPIEAGDASADEYDVDAIADAIVSRDDDGYFLDVDERTFWEAVEEHAIPAPERIETPTPSPELREEIEATFAAWVRALALLSTIDDDEQHMYLAELLHGARQALDRALYRTLDDDFDAAYFVGEARGRVKLAIDLFTPANL